MDNDVTKQVATNKPTFTDIVGEEWREYQFPNGVVRIEKPVKLNVKRKPEGDSHRLIDAAGVAHYIPVGWLSIRWGTKEGSNPYRF